MNKEVSDVKLLGCNKNTTLQKHVFALWEAARFQVRTSINKSMFM